MKKEAVGKIQVPLAPSRKNFASRRILQSYMDWRTNLKERELPLGKLSLPLLEPLLLPPLLQLGGGQLGLQVVQLLDMINS